MAVPWGSNGFHAAETEIRGTPRSVNKVMTPR